MSTSRCARSLVVGLVALVALLALTAGGARAEKPQRIHDNFEDTFPANFCGIDVTVHVEGVSNFTFVLDESGNIVESKVTGNVEQTLTAANGRSVTIVGAGHATLDQVVENPDGTVTFVQTWRGLPEKIVGAQGGPLLRDAGLITVATTIDFSGPEPVVVGRQILANKGPHPEAESDFALFCEVVTEALS